MAVGVVFRACRLPSRAPLSPGGPGVRCPVRWVRKKAIRPRIDRVQGVTKSVMAPAYHRLWMLKLAHENSYLSWSRNAAICAGVAATIRIIDNEHDLPVSGDVVMGFIDLGLMFLAFGSLQHVYSAYRLKKLSQISNVGFAWTCTYTSAVGLLYYVLVRSNFK